MNNAALERISQLFKVNDNSIHPDNDFEMNGSKAGTNPTEYSVYLRNAIKSYGFKFNQVSVLKNLNATIAKGQIYALMGPSGCGKTTLLSCILGSKKLNNGKIWVLGGTPGTKNSRVPGPSVGYMPQEIALYDSFTIEETLLYFGWIAGMTTDQIKPRSKFLKELLTLDHTNEYIRNLSGGEQRRVSLAAALVHESEMLILDEPTVGLDSLIRETVWSYLTQLAIEKNITVVITTHYIEEARQAQTVALMREGTLLTEEPPDTLIRRFGHVSLEETFLKLSVIQNKNFVTQNGSRPDQVVAEDFNDSNYKYELPDIPFERKCDKTLSDFVPNFNRNRIKALLFKGLLWMLRNFAMMFIVVVLPLVIVSIFYFSIGRSPEDLPVAILNQETHNMKNCDSSLTCNSTQLSCCYTKYLEIQAIKLVYYETEEDAVQSVFSGKSYASIVIRENYTKAIRARIDNGETTKPWNLKYSEIDVFRDVANKPIATYLKIHLHKTFLEFLEDYMESCGKPRRALQIPINFQDPVYGVMEPNFTDSILPSIILIITFNLAVIATSILMLIERKEGSLERTYVIGIIDEELLLAHFICEFCMTLIQVILTIFWIFFVFSMTMKGSLILVFFICCLSGICGISLGFFISCVCDNELTAGLLATGSLICSFFICGVIWPLEAVHYLIKPFAYLLPFSTATQSLRNILQKGWDLSLSSVYIGFFAFGIWSLLLIIASMVLLKFKK